MRKCRHKNYEGRIIVQQFPPPPESGTSFAAYQPVQGQPQHGYPGHQPYPGQPASQLLSPQSLRKIALKYGLIFGAILIVCYLLETGASMILMQQMFQHPSTSSTGLITYTIYNYIRIAVFTLIYWSIYFLAGIFAARRAQRVGTAFAACLWASLCYLVVYCLVVGSGVVTNWNVIARGDFSTSMYLMNIGTGFALTCILHIGLGLGIGALGGLLGKSLSPGRSI